MSHSDVCEFNVDWQQVFVDRLDTLIEQGFVVIDDCFSSKALVSLQEESGFVRYRQATLTQGENIQEIRGDKIRWIDTDCTAGYAYLQSIEQLAQFFNASLFAGIRQCEAHYACYPVGFGYQWHSDNPIGRDERVLSAVFYLNDEWSEEDGGALEVVCHQQVSHHILPKANRLVVFDSNLRHQVQIAHRMRYSIATWMRRDLAIY